MKNFDFEDLTLVGPLPELLPIAGWWASGAEELVTAGRRAETLQQALADCAVSIATTSSRGRTLEQVLTPPGVAALRNELADDQTLAIVFGREDRGLTSEETDLCGRIASIPTSSRFPTMNLAQSVSLFCYEMRRSESGSESERRLAPLELVHRLHDRAASLLLEVGFLHDDNPEGVYVEMRALAARAQLTHREAELLLGMIRQVEWKLKNK